MQENGESISSRKAGYILRAKLRLSTNRSNDGYFVHLNEHKERIGVLKEKYGFSEENPNNSDPTSSSQDGNTKANKSEHVNVDNVAGDPNKDSEEMTKGDMPF